MICKMCGGTQAYKQLEEFIYRITCPQCGYVANLKNYYEKNKNTTRICQGERD